MAELLISVLVPAYNEVERICRCVDSIRRQTWGNLEIIVVDDGSTDRTADLVMAMAAADQRLRLVRHERNRGLSAARNTAIAAAHGEWLTFVDADDWLEPRFTETLIRLAAKTGCPLTACNHWIREPDGREWVCFPLERSQVLTDRQAAMGLLYHRVPDVSAWGKLYHRRLFENLRYPEGRLYEDTALILPLLRAAGSIAWTDTPLYHYAQSAGSITGGGWRWSRLDYIQAVKELTAAIRATWPELARGCTRRECHAYLSTRRYLIDCPAELRALRGQLDEEILRRGRRVMCDLHTPARDRLALLALWLGDETFDRLWTRYVRHRGR